MLTGSLRPLIGLVFDPLATTPETGSTSNATVLVNSRGTVLMATSYSNSASLIRKPLASPPSIETSKDSVAIPPGGTKSIMAVT